MTYHEPPPTDDDNLQLPPGHDQIVGSDDYMPEETCLFAEPSVTGDRSTGAAWSEPDDAGWSWHDARLIGVDRGEVAGERRYEIGALDVYADAASGDLGGSYLAITAYPDQAAAVDFYHDLQRQIHAEWLAEYDLPGFAEARAFEMNPEPENWRGATAVEYAAYEHLRDLEAFDPARADDPPEAVLDPLLRTAIELGGVVAEPEPVVEEAAFQALPSANALAAIGMQAADVDPDAQPPPFYDAETGTAYWIGVFQPDKDDRANCMTSILSLRRDAQTGELQAQLAPCVPGNWDKACAAAEYLTEVAHKDGMEQVFDVAKGMALATGQRDLWQNQRGVPLEFDAARDIAADTRAGWEVEL